MKGENMKTGCIIAILIYLAVLVASWLIYCGLFWLVCLCFNWTFTWGVATGVWICLLVLSSIFKVTVKK